MNVRLAVPHEVTAHYTLPEDQNNRPEKLYFERCALLIGQDAIPALIARTSTNFHGSSVLEIMADIHLRSVYALEDGDAMAVEVEAVQLISKPGSS